MRHLGSSLAVLLAAAGVCGAAQAATLFMGAYPDSLLVFDEAKGAMVQRIPLETGLPTALRLSDDKKRLYVTTITKSGIEVIDPTTRKVITEFSLNTPTTRYRFNGGAPDPTGKYFYTVLEQIDKKQDHYEVSKPKYAVIDLEKKVIARTYDVAEEDENGNRGFRNLLTASPDGKYLYQFRDKVIVLDTSNFKVVDRIDLATPEEAGIANVNLGGTLDSITQPGQFVSLFNASDPYIHNRVFGIARFDLGTRQVDFTPIGPAPDTMAGLQVAPDGKAAYTVVSTGGRLGNKRCEFWRFDMASKSIQQKAEFSCKTRFTFGMSGDGKKLYIYGASFQIEVYDAKTLKYEKTWDLNNDITGAGMAITP
jgi:hypothetical protein